MKINELEKEAEAKGREWEKSILPEREEDYTPYAPYYPYSVGYLAAAIPREERIKELESELRRVSLNEQLAINNGKNFLKQIAGLEAQIGKMKCCENCNNYQHRIDHRCNTKCKNLSAWEIREN